MSKIELVRRAFARDRIQWKKHALERMFERAISRLQVKEMVQHGKIIEEYSDDYPVPSMLIAGMMPEPLHVISVYRPDLIHFEKDLVTRRKR